MLINPTLHFLVERATQLGQLLFDPLHLLTERQLRAFQQEYDNIAAAMRAIKHPELRAAATYPTNEGTLWAWWCLNARLHESHSAMTLTHHQAPASCPGEASPGTELWATALSRMCAATNFSNAERNIES